MFTKTESHPTGHALSVALDKLPIIRLQGTWISGTPVPAGTPMSPTTTSWAILRCFVDSSGMGVWFIEYWKHDNGYRAEFQQVSISESRYLLKGA